MHSPFDSIIFDLDGTLWDCTAVTAKSITMLFQRLGITKEVTSSCIQRIAGRPVSECEAILLEGIAPGLAEIARKELAHFSPYTLEERGDLALYDGVHEGVAQLRERYRLFLVSNCGVPYLQSFMKFSGIGEQFEDVECFGNTLRPKDENIASVVKRNRLLQPCYIGDTESDEVAASLAGVPFFHVGYGFGDSASSSTSFETFNELVKYFTS